MLTVNRGHAILATDSKPLKIGLSALLLSIPPIERVDCISDVDQLLRDVAAYQPLMTLLDTSLAGPRLEEMSLALREIAPKSLTVLLSENPAEHRELVNRTTDTVILNGTDPSRLAHVLEIIISDYTVDD